MLSHHTPAVQLASLFGMLAAVTLATACQLDAVNGSPTTRAPALGASQATTPSSRIASDASEVTRLSTPAQDDQDDKDRDDTQDADTDDDKPLKVPVRIGERAFKLEVAADSLSRSKGLSGREKLKEDEGMIFAYPLGTERLSFWMKDCLIDIDIMFLNSRGRVIAMHEMKKEPLRQPNESELDYEYRLKRYPSERAAQYAVELSAGMIKKLKVKIGDQIEFDRAKLSALARENERREQQQDR